MPNISGLPLVSILLPSYNYAHTLESALASIFAQSYDHFEVIAADDGSTDASREILRAWQLKYPAKLTLLEHPGRKNKGIAETYRLALSRAKGSLTAFLEADDLWLPANLERKVSAYLSHSGKAGVVYSGYSPFGKSGPAAFWKLYEFVNRLETPKEVPHDAFSVFLKRNTAASFSNFMIETGLLRSIPFPRPDELFYDWWILAHAAARKPFIFLPERFVLWRIHSRSANFGTFSQKQLKDLHVFLESLYASLKTAGLVRQHMEILEKSADKMERHRAWAESGKLTEIVLSRLRREPWDGLRFLAHIILKKMLVK